ncbi:sensor histidine kinase [Nocardioides sp. CFH 31398]|uniref:sensor histidine kinase n=1 Tax=Nocardioides sp. CFH 31398 TaxID=2919579 RepID=UPI001F054922|nr:histidine kinase [Nocardioides sp. CFH 31398]MCH1867796.1 histidine kinase [Nocardioides sp. CFH 31398]
MTDGTALEPVRPPRSLPEPLRRALDATIVAVLVVAAAAVVVLAGAPLSWLALGLAQALPLWWRRRYPAVVLVAVSVASAAQLPVLDIPLVTQPAFPIAVYSAARFGAPATGWVALGVGVLAAWFAGYDWTTADTAVVNASTVTPWLLALLGIVATTWVLGTLGRVRASYVGALLERNEQIRREAEQRVALAATEERTRIAREMHDVVAHGLSVIIVQADGARYAAEHDPAAAPTALGTIARTGREALADMRRMLGLLREGETGTAPVPDLGSLRALVEDSQVPARLAGLERDVPGVVALTTYRVVQEALTNVRKHAGPDAGATVDVEVGATEVVVRVRDRGRGAAATPTGTDGPGHGLVGMRERVTALGGEVSAGPASGGGFAVSARIPL